MKRIMQTISVLSERLSEYCTLHDNIWPDVKDAICQAHLTNYSIFHSEGKLIQYMEYTGTDLAADMQKLSQSEAMQSWCAVCKAMQIPDNGQWSDLEEVFHLE